jgi:hypothetical protein
MKSVLILTASSLSLLAGPPEQPKPIKHEPPPVSYKVLPAPGTETFVYEQKPMGGRPVLIAPEQANALINRFQTNLAKLGNPRMVIYVNRELVDESSGLRLSGRTERIQNNSTEIKSDFKADPNAPAQPAGAAVPPGGNVTIVGNVSGLNRNNVPGAGNVSTKTEKTTHENTYKNSERATATLADKQTVRDVERLFGRPLRMAGVSLADQRVATQLLENKPLKALATEGEQARKDREALAKIADVAVEILISSRNITISELSGDRTYSLPDIQATAVRLSDAKVVAQATSSDITGKDRYAGNIVRNFDVREIAEATALALMEDMLLNVP